MFGKVLGAIVGEKIAGRDNRLGGALVGAAIPVIAKRGLATLGVALVAGWAAKRLIGRSRRTGAAASRHGREARG